MAPRSRFFDPIDFVSCSLVSHVEASFAAAWWPVIQSAAPARPVLFAFGPNSFVPSAPLARCLLTSQRPAVLMERSGTLAPCLFAAISACTASAVESMLGLRGLSAHELPGVMLCRKYPPAHCCLRR